jgi:hypothetical protein
MMSFQLEMRFGKSIYELENLQNVELSRIFFNLMQSAII